MTFGVQFTIYFTDYQANKKGQSLSTSPFHFFTKTLYLFGLV